MSRRPFLGAAPQGRNGEPSRARGGEENRLRQGRAGHNLLSNYNPVVLLGESVEIKTVFALWTFDFSTPSYNITYDIGFNVEASRYDWALNLVPLFYLPLHISVGTGTVSTQVDEKIEILDEDDVVLKTATSQQIHSKTRDGVITTAESVVITNTFDADPAISTFRKIKITFLEAFSGIAAQYTGGNVSGGLEYYEGEIDQI